MPSYKLVQKLYPSNRPWTEIFYDGQVQVVDNTVVVDKDHWRDQLIIKGFVEVDNDMSASTDPDTQGQHEPTPKAASAAKTKTTSRRKGSES